MSIVVRPGAINSSEIAARLRVAFGLSRTIDSFRVQGDPDGDDSNAIERALSSGAALDFGSRTYILRRPLTVNLAGLSYRSQGAKISFEAVEHTRHVLRLELDGGGLSGAGQLTIDVNRNANIGLYVLNDSDRAAVLNVVGLNVTNVYRKDRQHTGGDGIWIRGNFPRPILRDCTVRNCRMASGADVAGSQGIFGITVSDAGRGRGPGRVSILHCTISNVGSEDPAVSWDQDGIRVFAENHQEGDVGPFRASCLIDGCVFEDVLGRSVKVQSGFGSVVNCAFHRSDRGIPRIGTEEIEFQTGGGIVRNIECYYDNHVPDVIVSCHGAAEHDGIAAGGSVQGLRAYVKGDATLPCVLRSRANQEDVVHFNAKDIHLFGARIGYMLSAQGGLASEEAPSPSGGSVHLSDITADCLKPWLRVISRDLDVICTNLTQTGSEVALIETDPSKSQIFRSDSRGLRGFAKLN